MNINSVEFVIDSSDKSSLEFFPGISGAMCYEFECIYNVWEWGSVADNHGSQLSVTFSSIALWVWWCNQVTRASRYHAQCPLLILLPISPHASCHSSWIQRIVNSLLGKMIQLSLLNMYFYGQLCCGINICWTFIMINDEGSCHNLGHLVESSSLNISIPPAFKWADCLNVWHTEHLPLSHHIWLLWCCWYMASKSIKLHWGGKGHLVSWQLRWSHIRLPQCMWACSPYIDIVWALSIDIVLVTAVRK